MSCGILPMDASAESVSWQSMRPRLVMRDSLANSAAACSVSRVLVKVIVWRLWQAKRLAIPSGVMRANGRVSDCIWVKAPSFDNPSSVARGRVTWLTELPGWPTERLAKPPRW